MRSLPFDATATPQNLLARVNAGEVSAAPPKVVPPARQPSTRPPPPRSRGRAAVGA